MEPVPVQWRTPHISLMFQGLLSSEAEFQLRKEERNVAKKKTLWIGDGQAQECAASLGFLGTTGRWWVDIRVGQVCRPTHRFLW